MLLDLTTNDCLPSPLSLSLFSLFMMVRHVWFILIDPLFFNDDIFLCPYLRTFSNSHPRLKLRKRGHNKFYVVASSLHEWWSPFTRKTHFEFQTYIRYITHYPLVELSYFQKCPNLGDDTHFLKVFLFIYLFKWMLRYCYINMIQNHFISYCSFFLFSSWTIFRQN